MRPWLWLADIAGADAAWLETVAAAFSASERARLARIARPARRAQFVGAHLLLRHLVAARAALAADAVRVESTAHGVAIAAPTGWRASLAHAGNWVAALAGDAPLGVDVESMNGARAIEAIVEAACGRRAASRTEAYLLWVQHEAELKCAVQGMPTHVGVWEGLALAACVDAAPQVARFEFARPQAPQSIRIEWTTRPPLRDATA
jgi:4'-phosphopantetheinyl transferase